VPPEDLQPRSGLHEQVAARPLPARGASSPGWLARRSASLGSSWASFPEQFFRSYLVAFLFWQGLSLGALAILMLVYLMGGRWGYLVRQALEAGSKTLWLAALLFAPLVFGLSSLYPWARPEALAADPLLQAKSVYLNVPFFLVRTVLYFIIWIVLARLLIGWSRIPEYTSDPVLRRRFQRVSSLGLILYVLTMTFASIDWIMSLQPDWVSTIFGLLIITGQALAGLALGIAVLPLVADIPPLSGLAHPGRFRDLGALLLTMVVLWAYIAFSQYLIIWSANIPREATCYLNRSAERGPGSSCW
jgi:hypothetical protein